MGNPSKKMIRSDAVNIRPHSIPAIGWRPNRDDIDWPIERVILGTGEPDADGWVLDRGQFYASDVVVGDLGTTLSHHKSISSIRWASVKFIQLAAVCHEPKVLAAQHIIRL